MSGMRRNNSRILSFDLRPHQEGLIQLSELLGLRMDINIAKILIELLNMQVAPEELYKMLRIVAKSNKKSQRYS